MSSALPASAADQPGPIAVQFSKLKDDLKALQDFNDPIGVYARMPMGWDLR
jgi:hypothetical protein